MEETAPWRGFFDYMGAWADVLFVENHYERRLISPFAQSVISFACSSAFFVK